jgi:hypothetical protein
MSIEGMFRVLDQVEREGVESIQRPPEEFRSEFGFGRAHGILVTVARIRTLLEEELEAQEFRARKQEDDL